jgi:hypothetical protein
LLQRVMREQLNNDRLSELASAVAEQHKDPYAMVDQIIAKFGTNGTKL